MNSSKALLFLKSASAVVIAFGAIIALAAWPPAAGIATFFADLLFWPYDGAQNVDPQSARLLAAISGGVMVGWGLLLWQIVAKVWPIDPLLAGGLIRSSLWAWFVVDSAASAIAGAPLNVLLNALFLAAFLLPLQAMAAERTQA